MRKRICVIDGQGGGIGAARPNPVLVTALKLLERNGNVLKVHGLEAIDGTPVIDIKPYVQGYHSAENSATPEWMEKIHAMLEEEQ